MGEWGPVFDETRSRSNFRPTAVIVIIHELNVKNIEQNTTY